MSVPEFITDSKGNFYLSFQSELVSGYLPVPIPKGNPVLRWHGPKIDIEKEWYPATFFMFEHLKHEVVLRLFCTPDRKEIVVRPFTQIYGTGMHVKEQPTKEDYEEIAALGWTDIGTLHSHCTTKAFASGTDTHDEANWPGGLHITVGELDEDRYDIHSRFAWDVPGQELNGQVVRKAERTLQNPALVDWFSLPPYAAEFIRNEPELEESIIGYLLTKPMIAPYPAWWNEKLIAPPPPPADKNIPRQNWEKGTVDMFGNVYSPDRFPDYDPAFFEPPPPQAPTPKELRELAKSKRKPKPPTGIS